MTVEVWPRVTVGGKEYWEVPSLTRIEVDPVGGVFYLVGTPDGSTGTVGALVKGDPGKHTLFDTDVDLTVLDADDATAASAEVVELVPGSDSVSQVVQLKLSLHEGPKGDDGDTVLDPADYTDAVAKQYPAVNDAGTAFELVTPKVGDRYFPATIANIASGNPTYTLAPVSIPAQDFDWRPEVHASCEVTGTGPDVKVDLVARLGTTGILNPETAGNIVGRALGSAGQFPPVHVMTPGPAAGESDTIDKVSQGNPAVIYVRAERQTGADTFTTTADRTRIWVKVNPIP